MSVLHYLAAHGLPIGGQGPDEVEAAVEMMEVEGANKGIFRMGRMRHTVQNTA